MAKQKWAKVKDVEVRNIWKCEDCGEKAVVNPDWYEQNGTPMCTKCDIDMIYDHTVILVK